MPLRLLVAEGGTIYDLRFLDWGSAVGADRLPRVIEVWKGIRCSCSGSTPRRPRPTPGWRTRCSD